MPDQHLSLETALRYALERDELRVYYQPIIDLASGKVTGVEALIRWQRSESELVPPLDFIPLAEETGLILPIGEWVLRTACAQGKVWRDGGLPPVRISVNLSAQHLRQKDLARQIEIILREQVCHPNALRSSSRRAC